MMRAFIHFVLCRAYLYYFGFTFVDEENERGEDEHVQIPLVADKKDLQQ